jgi:hypothetical protein
MVFFLAPLVVAPSLGFRRATLGLEMGTSRREATRSEVSLLFWLFACFIDYFQIQ